MSLPFVRTSTGLSVMVDSESVNVRSDHPLYKVLLEAITDGDEEKFLTNYSTKAGLKRAFLPNNALGVEVTDDGVTWNGKTLSNVLVERILEFRTAGLPFEPMVKFLENLMANPSSRAVEELYKFLEHEALPVTDDGCFLAYKTIRDDWYSKTGGSLTLLQGKADSSGRIFNGVGETIECVRNEVDDDRDRTCSKGLHAGSLAYAGPGGHFNSSGDKVVIVKINPKDAVSVPSDYQGQKLRCCKYEVIGEYKEKLAGVLYTKDEVTNDYSAMTDDDCDEEDELITDTWINWEAIHVNNVRAGDYVTFDYDGKNRALKVTEASPTLIDGELIGVDDTFESIEELGEFRTFKKDKMTNVFVAE